jgi:hypothetical protein
MIKQTNACNHNKWRSEVYQLKNLSGLNDGEKIVAEKRYATIQTFCKGKTLLAPLMNLSKQAVI